MTREPDWTKEEFEILLQHPELSNEELHTLISRRSPGAIAAVRGFVCAYHTPGKAVDLSHMMITRLMKGGYACRRCGTSIPRVVGPHEKR